MAVRTDRGIREYLEELMPPGGRARRVIGWGVVAWTGIGALILLWVLGRALERVAGVVPYLVMASLVVFVLNPAVRALRRMGLPHALAATGVFLVALAVTALVLALAVPVLIHQGESLITTSPRLVEKGGGLFERLSRSTNPVVHRAGDAGVAWVRAHAGNAPRALRTLTDAGLRLAHAGLVLIVGGFLGFLLLLSLPDISRGLSALIPAPARDRMLPPLAEVRRIVTGFVRARLVVSAAVGVIATIGLWAIHMPFWLVLGVIVGVANLIPMLGSWIGGVPVALVALLTKPPSYLVAVLLVVVVAHLIDGWILSPVVLRETTDLHPVVILLAVLVGAEIAGFWGILAAIPAAGVLQFVLREWAVPRLTELSLLAEPAVEEMPLPEDA